MYFFLLIIKNFFGRVLKPLKNLKISIGKFRNYCLKFCQIMPQKNSFQTALMIKALASW